MDKFCPECGRVYPDAEIDRCEDDNERLLKVHEEPDLVGQTMAGKYHLRSVAGQGGMGTVYIAYQESMGRDVAIKVLRSRFNQNMVAIRRFHREARAASKLTHPNTITVYDSGQTDEGHLFLVMELLSGSALSDILAAERRLPVGRVLRILAQVCDSLSEAHTQGIVHRDLKAENVFIDQKSGNPDHVKVLDFGIAKMAEEEVTQATATGMICGTPSYMSPEQAMGRELTGRSDIYSIGILMYELLVGDRPYSGDSPMEVMLKHINDPIPSLPEGVAGDLRGPIDALLERVLAKRPQDRPATCQELKTQLLALVGGEGVTGPIEAMHVADMGPVGSRRVSANEKTGINRAAESTYSSAVHRLNRVMWAAALALAVVGGLVAFMVVPEREAPAADEVSAAETTTPDSEPSTAEQQNPSPAIAPAEPGVVLAEDPPEAEKIAEVTLKSEPPGARVVDGAGAELGVTPWTFAHPPGSVEREVRLKKRGYQDAEVQIAQDAEGTIQVMLVKTPAARPASPTRSRTKSKPAAGRRDPKKDRSKQKGSTKEDKPKHFGTF